MLSGISIIENKLGGKIKKGLSDAITTVVEKYGFVKSRPNAMHWVRHDGFVGHAIGVSKLKGPLYSVGCYAFLNDPAIASIGGDLSHSSVGVGESLAHHSWRIDSEAQLTNASKEICDAIQEIALLWFALFQSVPDFNGIYEVVHKSNRFSNNTDVFSDLPASDISQGCAPVRPVAKEQFDAWAGGLLAQGFAARGYLDVHGDGRVFRRERGVVSDVVYVYLINLGLHFGVRAVNWVPEVSAQGSREFSSSVVPFLNGGPVSEHGSPGGDAFFLGSRDIAKRSVESFFSIYDRNTDPYLRGITTTEEFIASIHTNAVGLARTMLRQNGLLHMLRFRTPAQ